MFLNRLWILLAKKHNQELTQEEQEELEQLLLQHQEAFELNESFSRIKNLGVKKISTTAEEQRSRDAIAARIYQEAMQAGNNVAEVVPLSKRLHRYKITLLCTAASCLLIIGITWFSLNRKSEPATLIEQTEIVTSDSKSKLRLPDGSTVILNRQSRLAYNKDFGVHKREINLTGEAYFDIAHSDSVPLNVTAGLVKIRVMGTAFNVRAYSKDSIVETALIRGSIEVSTIDDPEKAILMHPNDKVLFKNNIALHLPNKTTVPEAHRPVQPFVQLNRIQPNPTDSTINEIAWVQDKLVFKKEPFYSLAKKMESWYQVKIRFNDKISEQLSLTGSLEKENLTEALDALRQITPFNYKVDNGLVTISRKQTLFIN